MKVNIQINIEDASDEIIAALGLRGSVSAQAVAAAVAPETLPEAADDAEPEPATPADDVPENDHAEDKAPAAAEPAETAPAEKRPNTAAALIQSFGNLQRSRTQSIGVGGKKLKNGDYVTHEGDTWVIVQTYRGLAVLENEAGLGTTAKADEMVPCSDGEDGDDAPSTVADATADSVKALYVEVARRVSNGRATELMRSVAEGKRLTELDAHELNKAQGALQAELDRFEAADA